MRKALGRYIVADSKVCHGELTFRGTRVLVKDVLEQVAGGMDWDAIVEEWRGSFPKAAIAEAVRLASEALLARKAELAPGPAKQPREEFASAADYVLKKNAELYQRLS